MMKGALKTLLILKTLHRILRLTLTKTLTILLVSHGILDLMIMKYSMSTTQIMIMF